MQQPHQVEPHPQNIPFEAQFIRFYL